MVRGCDINMLRENSEFSRLYHGYAIKILFAERQFMIPGVDGLRAIAILLVFAFHTGYIEVGWVGVQLFFVLSGFLITGILLKMKESLPAGQYFGKFYGRRFLRIFPLYYFYLALMAVIAYKLIAANFRVGYMQIYLNQMWAAVSYVYDIFYRVTGFQQSNFLDHFWSLSVEEQFYIFWPLLILLIPNKHLKTLFIAFIVLGSASRLVLYLLYVSGSKFWVFREPFALVIYSWPLSHLDAFGLGAYISRFSIPHPKRQLVLGALLVPLIGFVTTFLARGNFGLVTALGYQMPLGEGYKSVWADTLLNYFFAVLIYCVVYEKIFTKFLEMPVLSYLGKISYGMYVYHFPLIWFTNVFIKFKVDGDVPFWEKTLLALLATILVSTLSYFFLEKPLLSLKDRLFNWSKKTI